VVVCLGFILAGIVIIGIGILIPILIPIGLLIIGVFATYLLGHYVRRVRRKGKPS
jgi:hypothetical protein